MGIPQKDFSEARKQIPPIWRGLGLLLILLMPVLAISSAIVFIKYALEQGWPIYWPLVGYIRLPAWIWQVPVLNVAAAKIASIPNILGYILFSVLFLVVLYTLLSLLYAFIYRNLGVSRYAPTDIKQPRVKVKRYRR